MGEDGDLRAALGPSVHMVIGIDVMHRLDINPIAETECQPPHGAVLQHRFITNGKVLVNPGWLAVYGKEAQDEDANLVAVAAGERVRTESVDVNALKTKPPARYTEATLLSAMEGAGKLIDDEELRDAMKEKGLGTPATRAQTIEEIGRAHV